MTDAVTSRQLGVEDSSVNATATATVTGSLAGHVSPSNAAIMRATILLTIAVFNVSGNGFTLITIRLTPRLWTKTNFILASMLVADILTGVTMFWYSPFVLAVFVFNDPCRFNVAITLTLSLGKIAPLVSMYHLILTSIERYIAIVHPLQYETKVTDRNLKLAIAAVWVAGTLVAISWSFWLINADLRKCDLVPGHFYLTDVVVVYMPVCITMIFVYGKILPIWWRQRKLVHPLNAASAPGTSGQCPVTATSFPSAQISNADNAQDARKKPMTSAGPPSKPTVTTVASADVAQQQRQMIKSRRREFKAVYLSAAIVGSFVLLWFPNVLGRILASAGYDQRVVNYIFLTGGAFGTFNFASSWVVYAAVSKSYRRAYRQLLIRIGCCCCKNVALQGDISTIG